MSMFYGTQDARMPTYPTTLKDETWIVRSGRRDFSPRRRGDSEFGARSRFWTLWSRPQSMSGDLSGGYAQSGQDAANSGRWSPWQRATRGNGTVKFIMGQCKDGSDVGVSGATVQGFLTATDAYVGETTADSLGNYELGTPYPGAQHYLVAYRAGSPDIAGTTVNTLIPTNRDGT